MKVSKIFFTRYAAHVLLWCTLRCESGGCIYVTKKAAVRLTHAVVDSLRCTRTPYSGLLLTLFSVTTHKFGSDLKKLWNLLLDDQVLNPPHASLTRTCLVFLIPASDAEAHRAFNSSISSFADAICNKNITKIQHH